MIDDANKKLFGFDPYGDLIDKLDVATPSAAYSNDEERRNALMHECFTLHRWSKTGDELKPLSPPKDDDGNELYFGSIVDFDKIPVCHPSIDTLKFWLDTRQVKCPDLVADIRKLVSTIWLSHANTLKPIPKVLMRGVSGWIKEEVLTQAEGVEEIEWQIENDLLHTLTKSFPILDEAMFSGLYGKRNGTRLRLLKHIQGGSFDLSKIKAAYDMVHKLYADKKLLVIEAECAPSQKLKEDNKDAFHSIRLCIEVDMNNKFLKFHEHPSITCGCPNGCILCAHLGGIACMCFAVVKFCKTFKTDIDEDTSNSSKSEDEDDVSFDDVKRYFPEPVHELVRKAIPATYAFPGPTSKKNKTENQFRHKHGMLKKGKGKGRGRGTRRGRKEKAGSTNSNVDCNGEETLNTPTILDGLDAERAEVELELESSDNLADLREYMIENGGDDNNGGVNFAIPGVPDNSISPVIDVISKVEAWVTALIHGRDDKGREKRAVAEIDNHTRLMALHKESDIYKAKQLKRCSNLHDCLRRKKKKDDEWREKNGLVEGGKEDTKPKSILLDLLDATNTNRETKQYEIRGMSIDEELRLDEMNQIEW